MPLIPKNANELNDQLNGIEDDLSSCSEGFRILRESKFTLKDIVEKVDVTHYDNCIKKFEPIQYYVSFMRRKKVLDCLEYIEELRTESYEDFISSGNEPLSRDEYEVYKAEKIELEQYELKDYIPRIITGDSVNIYENDLQHVEMWYLSQPVRSLDMKGIAFENRRHGFVGGMDEKSYNDIILKVLGESPTSEDLSKLRGLPEGYGWPTKGLGQHIWAEIDLNTPDDILFEAFKNWVHKSRQLSFFADSNRPFHLMSAKSIKSSHIKKWQSLRILAYLDLKILSLLTNVSITLKQYGDVLYYDEFDIDTTEKVRKTLIPLVNSIMDYGYLDGLLKKIIAENK